MANPGDRAKLLQKFGLTEALLRGLFTSKAPAEGVWLAEHELKYHIEWAKQRHEFILDAIAERYPSDVIPGRRKPKAVPIPNGPPIVSHRGRSRADTVYGETIG